MKHKYGKWTFREDNNTLQLPEGYPYGAYYFDLDRTHSSAAVLDQIFQISGKIWATPRITKSLLTAITELVDPQANLCSGGAEKTLGKKKPTG